MYSPVDAHDHDAAQDHADVPPRCPSRLDFRPALARRPGYSPDDGHAPIPVHARDGSPPRTPQKLAMEGAEKDNEAEDDEDADGAPRRYAFLPVLAQPARRASPESLSDESDASDSDSDSEESGESNDSGDAPPANVVFARAPTIGPGAVRAPAYPPAPPRPAPTVSVSSFNRGARLSLSAPPAPTAPPPAAPTATTLVPAPPPAPAVRHQFSPQNPSLLSPARCLTASAADSTFSTTPLFPSRASGSLAAPQPAPATPLLPLRLTYPHRGFSRAALVQTKALWISRESKWTEWEEEVDEFESASGSSSTPRPGTPARKRASADSSYFFGYASDAFDLPASGSGHAATTHTSPPPSPAERDHELRAHLRLHVTPPLEPSPRATSSPGAGPASPGAAGTKDSLSPTAFPRAGDLRALHDPRAARADRCFKRIPVWTVSKTLWAHDMRMRASGAEGAGEADARPWESDWFERWAVLAKLIARVGEDVGADVTSAEVPVARPGQMRRVRSLSLALVHPLSGKEQERAPSIPRAQSRPEISSGKDTPVAADSELAAMLQLRRVVADAADFALLAAPPSDSELSPSVSPYAYPRQHAATSRITSKPAGPAGRKAKFWVGDDEDDEDDDECDVSDAGARRDDGYFDHDQVAGRMDADEDDGCTRRWGRGYGGRDSDGVPYMRDDEDDDDSDDDDYGTVLPQSRARYGGGSQGPGRSKSGGTVTYAAGGGSGRGRVLSLEVGGGFGVIVA